MRKLGALGRRIKLEIKVIRRVKIRGIGVRRVGNRVLMRKTRLHRNFRRSSMIRRRRVRMRGLIRRIRSRERVI